MLILSSCALTWNTGKCPLRNGSHITYTKATINKLLPTVQRLWAKPATTQWAWHTSESGNWQIAVVSESRIARPVTEAKGVMRKIKATTLRGRRWNYIFSFACTLTMSCLNYSAVEESNFKYLSSFRVAHALLQWTSAFSSLGIEYYIFIKLNTALCLFPFTIRDSQRSNKWWILARSWRMAVTNSVPFHFSLF